MIEAQDHKNEQEGLTVLYGMKMNAANLKGNLMRY